MKTLLHVCCGPCTIYPLEVLKEIGHNVTGYFYNPNIHPFKEFQRRLESLESFADDACLPLIIDRNYGLTDFIQKVAFKEKKRCSICYLMRLEKCAREAAENGFDTFSTTLLYSRYQNHEMLISYCNDLAVRFNINFFYKDFREGWQRGIDSSKDLGLYRQPYCGCIYSEQERYDKSLRKKKSTVK